MHRRYHRWSVGTMQLPAALYDEVLRSGTEAYYRDVVLDELHYCIQWWSHERTILSYRTFHLRRHEDPIWPPPKPIYNFFKKKHDRFLHERAWKWHGGVLWHFLEYVDEYWHQEWKDSVGEMDGTNAAEYCSKRYAYLV